MSRLEQMECVACRGGTPRLEGDELDRLAVELNHAWRVVEAHHLISSFSFPDFRGALQFTNRVGELAEAQNHHPDITLTWGRVDVKIWTHKIDGLTESDFVFAAKTQALYSEA